MLHPSLDSIQESSINKTNYTAELGGKSGGVINVITKSGTNTLHGDAYEFIRNDIFDARNFFDPGGQAAPPFRENRSVAHWVGPLSETRPSSSPTMKARSFGSPWLTFSAFRLALSGRKTFRTGDDRHPISHQAFAGNAIDLPVSLAAVALLTRVPLPNLPGASNNLLSIGQRSNKNNQYNARLDHQLSVKDIASARASVFDANEADPFGSSVLNEALLPGFGRTLKTHSVNLLLGETHTFSAGALNEFRFGWLRVSGGQGDPNAGNNFAAQYGLLGATANPRDFGYPQVSLSNAFTTMGDATGFTTRLDRNFELYDNVTVHHGAHALQFGGYLFHLAFNPSFPNDARGIYTFNTFGTAGRNVVTEPGLATVDLSLQREGTVYERLKLQFRLDVYNSLNHANFDLPGRIFGASNFGVITSAEDPRELQLALKLMF